MYGIFCVVAGCLWYCSRVFHFEQISSCLSVCLILCSYLFTFYPGSGRAACDLLNVYRQLNLTIWVLHGLHYEGSLWKMANFVLVETTVNLFSC